MSLLLLVLFIVLLFGINMKLTNNDFISPANIVFIMLLFSLMIATYFYHKVQYEVSVESVSLLMFVLLSFSVPCLFLPHRVKDVIVLQPDQMTFLSKKVLFFSFFFILITTFLLYKEVMKVSSLLGYVKSSDLSMLYYYRGATLSGAAAIASRNKIVGQMTIASFAVAYIVLIDFGKRIVYGLRYFSKIIWVMEIGTLFAYLTQCILSGGRTQFLYYIESFIVIILFYLQKRSGRSIDGKYLKRIIIGIIGAYIVFYLLGGLTGKTSKLDFSSTLFVYLGSPIPAFSQLVEGNIKFQNEYWGCNVFIGIIQLLNRFGANLPVVSEAAPNVNVGNLTTNIYGSFGRIYASFGMLGLFFYNTFIGTLYQRIYNKLHRCYTNVELYLALYLVVIKTLFDYGIEERFFLSVVSLGTILRIIYIFIFYYLFNYIHLSFGKIHNKV